MVSICCITYNHELFIIDALTSFLSQQANFIFEIIVSDDNSIDNTIHLTTQFAQEKNVKIIIYKNVPNIGVGANFLAAIKKATGKYVAICEGDDFWNASYKLQKQFDFLENHPEISVCGHLSHKLLNNKLKPLNFSKKGTIFSFNDFIIAPFFHTSSFFFNREIFLNQVPLWYDKLYAVDNFTILILSIQNKIGLINEYMSVYRINQYSISNKQSILTIANNYITHLQFFDAHSDFKFTHLIKKVSRIWNVRVGYLLPSKERKAILKKEIAFIFINFSLIESIKLLIKYFNYS